MTKKTVPPEMAIRILKIATCSTLSGRSELTYHIGCTPNGDIQIRVVQNSGNGQFNADWVPLSLIKKLLLAQPADKPMTSAVMSSVFRGKSSNSAAFAFAALKAEGLVKTGEEKDSGYVLDDMEAFKRDIAALIATGNDLAVATDNASTPSKGHKLKQKES